MGGHDDDGRPSGAKPINFRLVQGLTPLAKDRRPSGAKTINSAWSRGSWSRGSRPWLMTAVPPGRVGDDFLHSFSAPPGRRLLARGVNPWKLDAPTANPSPEGATV